VRTYFVNGVNEPGSRSVALPTSPSPPLPGRQRALHGAAPAVWSILTVDADTRQLWLCRHSASTCCRPRLGWSVGM